jgi:hypothetical protein
MTTPAERQRKRRDKLDRAGLILISVVCPRDSIDAVRTLGATLVAAHEARAITGDYGEPMRQATLDRRLQRRNTTGDKT